MEINDADLNNSLLLLRFLEAKVAMAFRGRLTKEAYTRYMTNQTYYRVSNLDGRLDNPDHCLTDDISSFTTACAHLYSHVSKPILDATTVSYSLIKVKINLTLHYKASPHRIIGYKINIYSILHNNNCL